MLGFSELMEGFRSWIVRVLVGVTAHQLTQTRKSGVELSEFIYLQEKLSQTLEYAKDHAYFFTATCLEWKHVLADDVMKEIVVDSLRFLTRQRRVDVFAFCIMSNHIHLIWQMLSEHKRENIQRDFLKYTGQQILNRLRETDSKLLNELFVGAKDRKYQVWERNALSISLESERFFFQKLEYIHQNPVKAGICSRAVLFFKCRLLL